MNDDIEDFYSNLKSNERRSRWLSGFKMEVCDFPK